MRNHIHLIAVPESREALANSIRDVHGKYASRFNRKYEFTGHVWEARFYSTPLDQDHLWAAVRYVERNPVRANLVERSEDYRWSSAPTHVYGSEDSLIDRTIPLIEEISDWSAWLEDEGDPAHVRSIRKATSAGQPCGSDHFIKKLEAQLGHSIEPRPRGPKPKHLAIGFKV
jgi:putative transposase